MAESRSARDWTYARAFIVVLILIVFHRTKGLNSTVDFVPVRTPTNKTAPNPPEYDSSPDDLVTRGQSRFVVDTTPAGIKNTTEKPYVDLMKDPRGPPEDLIKKNWTGLLQYRNYSNSTVHAHGLRNRCHLTTDDHRAKGKVQDLIVSNTALLEYTILFANYSGDPLANNSYLGYKSNIWSRIVSPQGQTILNLAFNYDIMSLMTLSFGIQKVGPSLKRSL